MAGQKDILNRMKSAKNIKKTTYAMKLVSAAKLKKTQESVARSKEFKHSLVGLLAELLIAAREEQKISHPLTEPKEEVKKVRLIVISSNKGLCGGFNSSCFKEIERTKSRLESEGKEITSVLWGRKAAEFYRRKDYEYLESLEELSDNPSDWPIDDLARSLEAQYANGDFDEAWIIYTDFKSALTMEASSKKIIPLEADDVLSSLSGAEPTPGMTKFEPSLEVVYKKVIPRILASEIRQACLDTKAGEHGSRMTAMDAATTNAGDLIKSLKRTYNKLRQESITGELLDIIGGASAVS